MKNKKIIISLIIAAILLLTLLSGCTVKTETEQKSGREDFAGKKLGIVTGTMFESVAKKQYPEAELCYYNSCSDLAEALEAGKIDAYMH